jgi:hypothetical protein
MTRMKVEIELSEPEVLILRTGGQVPLSVRDKLGDAVYIRPVGWYLVDTAHAPEPRPRWWDGTEWWWGPDQTLQSGGPAIVHSTSEPERLYLADER